jgi:hypothetical protein
LRASRLARALAAPSRPVHWDLDYELGSKVGGGAFGGRRDALPRWNTGSKPLHECSTDPAVATEREAARPEVRLSYDACARDGGSSVGRWAASDYVGARMEMLGKEAAAGTELASRRPPGRQQQGSAPVIPDHYNMAPASAATHRREHVAVNGKGKKLGPYGPLGGPPPAGGGGASGGGGGGGGGGNILL